MTYYRRENRLIHHVEIPKTATKSVKALIESHGWKEDAALIEKTNSLYSRNNAVQIEHHTHYDLYSKLGVTPDFEFTVVRNPIDRFVSSVYFLRDQWSKGYGADPRKVARPEEITSEGMIHFIHAVFTKLIPEHGRHVEHNLYLPQNLFVGPETAVFKFGKEGFDSLLKELVKNKIISSPCGMPRINPSTSGGFKKKKPNWNYAPQVTEYFFDYYKDDFIKFCYEVPEYQKNDK